MLNDSMEIGLNRHGDDGRSWCRPAPPDKQGSGYDPALTFGKAHAHFDRVAVGNRLRDVWWLRLGPEAVVRNHLYLLTKRP